MKKFKLQIERLRNIARFIYHIIKKYPSNFRYIFSWYKSLLEKNFLRKYNQITSEVPFITFMAKKWLDSHLNSKMKVFEYGSGRSTFYISRRVKYLFSVEHNEYWYKFVSNRLKHKKIENCEYVLVKPDKDSPISNDKTNFKSNSMKYSNFNFKTYVLSIKKFPNEYFNLIFIDGRARNSCIKML